MRSASVRFFGVVRADLARCWAERWRFFAVALRVRALLAPASMRSGTHLDTFNIIRRSTGRLFRQPGQPVLDLRLRSVAVAFRRSIQFSSRVL